MKRIYLLCFLLMPFLSFAQEANEYLNTPEGITLRMLEMISIPQGGTIDWEEFRNMFLPTAHFMVSNKNAPEGRQLIVLTLEEFVTKAGPNYARSGFQEDATGMKVDEFNGIANVFQPFYAKNLTGTYEEKGINSYQLVYKENRWWIASLMFTNETDKIKVPAKYLYDKK